MYGKQITSHKKPYVNTNYVKPKKPNFFERVFTSFKEVFKIKMGFLSNIFRHSKDEPIYHPTIYYGPHINSETQLDISNSFYKSPHKTPMPDYQSNTGYSYRSQSTIRNTFSLQTLNVAPSSKYNQPASGKYPIRPQRPIKQKHKHLRPTRFPGNKIPTVSSTIERPSSNFKYPASSFFSTEYSSHSLSTDTVSGEVSDSYGAPIANVLETVDFRGDDGVIVVPDNIENAQENAVSAIDTYSAAIAPPITTHVIIDAMNGDNHEEAVLEPTNGIQSFSSPLKPMNVISMDKLQVDKEFREENSNQKFLGIKNSPSEDEAPELDVRYQSSKLMPNLPISLDGYPLPVSTGDQQLQFSGVFVEDNLDFHETTIPHSKTKSMLH